MNPKYINAYEIGIKTMNRFASNTEEYELGRRILAWACERNREEQKVELVFPPEQVGSLEEKIQHDAEMELVNN